MEWVEGKSGLLSETIESAATAAGEQGKLGWIYGGLVELVGPLKGKVTMGSKIRESNVLYQYNLTSMTAKKVATQDTIGVVEHGEMVYIPDAGENGVLVLVGGAIGHLKVGCLTVVCSSHSQDEGSQHGN